MSGARRMALVAAVLAIAAAPPELVKRDAMLPMLFEGRRALAAGDFAGASAALRRALTVTPGDPGLLFNLAQIEVRAGNKEAALRLLDTLATRGVGFDPSVDASFQQLADRPEYAELLARFDRAAPTIVRSTEAFRLADGGLFPEGIAADPRDGTLYVSSILRRKVVRVSPGGEVTDFVREKQDSLLGALGVRVDTKRRLLWVAASGGPEVPEAERDRSGLWAFDLATGTLARRWMVPGPAFLNDLAIDPRGRVYVTDSNTGAIYSTTGPGGELEVFLPAGELRGPNGIDVAADGRRLYVASSGRGITAVDLQTKATTGLAVPRDVVALGIDGLYTHGRTLIAVQNLIGHPRIVRFALRSPLEIESMEVLETRHPLHDLPTTGTIWRDQFFYVPNTHLDRVDANGAVAPSDTLGGPVILRMPLKG